MKNKETSPNVFNLTITEAIKLLQKKDIKAAMSVISNAITLNMHAPEPQNLLGILCEIQGDDNTARKHYRAAYALDPSYKAACRNLERLVAFEWEPQNREYYYGDETEENDIFAEIAINN